MLVKKEEEGWEQDLQDNFLFNNSGLKRLCDGGHNKERVR